jgi:hypothetical protein
MTKEEQASLAEFYKSVPALEYTNDEVSLMYFHYLKIEDDKKKREEKEEVFNLPRGYGQ